jgi:hypothetical protein
MYPSLKRENFRQRRRKTMMSYILKIIGIVLAATLMNN